MVKSILHIIKYLFFLSIGIFFIWIFIKQLSEKQIAEILNAFTRVHYGWIIFGLICGIISHVTRSYRWKMLLEPMGYHPKIRNVIGAVFVGYFANLAVPRLGEMSRCGILTKYEKIPFNKSFGTVVTERIFDVICFALIMTLAVFYEFTRLYQLFLSEIMHPLTAKLANNQSNILILIFIFTAVVVVVSIVLKRYSKTLHAKIFTLAHGFFQGVKSLIYIKKPVLFIVQTFIIWVMYFAMTYSGLVCLAESSHLQLSAGLSALAFGSIGIMIVQGGIGIYPVIIAKTISLYGISQTIGYALGWISWTSQTVLIIFAGLVSLLLLPYFNHYKHGKS